jgi:hypothetical protein
MLNHSDKTINIPNAQQQYIPLLTDEQSVSTSVYFHIDDLFYSSDSDESSVYDEHNTYTQSTSSSFYLFIINYINYFKSFFSK